MSDHDKDEASTGILGLGGAIIPKEPGDPTTSNSPDEVAQRRQRMREGEAEAATEADSDRQRSGATGIDMGGGGQGTDLSGK